MLTSDLVRARVVRGEVRPTYAAIDDRTLAAAADLIALFESAVGARRRELEEAIADRTAGGTEKPCRMPKPPPTGTAGAPFAFAPTSPPASRVAGAKGVPAAGGRGPGRGDGVPLPGSTTEFLLDRGLARLLLERCRFDPRTDIEPAELRRAVFEAAAAGHRLGRSRPFDRQAVLEAVAGDMDLGADDLEAGLFADLKGEGILVEFEACSPRWLLERYNVALAQAVLLRATRMRIDLAARSAGEVRALFTKIKFFRLLHRVQGSPRSGYAIELDGPVSLFRASQRYGMAMANFLPSLLHVDGWRLEATVEWSGRGRGPRTERLFRLSPDDGLVPCTRPLAGTWRPEEMAWLPDRFARLETDWRIGDGGRIHDLGGQGILIPDHEFRHPDGSIVFLEIVGYWRRSALASRIRLLREHGPANVILAVGHDLRIEPEDAGDLADLGIEIHVFRSAPVAREILAALERIRQRPGA